MLVIKIVLFAIGFLAGLTGFFSAIFGFAVQLKLKRILQERHPGKWEETTSLGTQGSGFSNSISALEFIRGSDLDHDPDVYTEKRRFGAAQRCFFISLKIFVSALIIIVVLSLFDN